VDRLKKRREKGKEQTGGEEKASERRGQKIALVRLKYDERFDRVSDGRTKLHIKLIPTAATTR